MRKYCLLFGLLVALGGALRAQESEAAPEAEEPTVFETTEWVVGPAQGRMASQAVIKVPEGFVFADGADTRRLMDAMQNPVSEQEMGFLAPESLDWFVVFEFDPVGYVNDEEKDSLDADALLESIRAGTEAGNVERRKRGWAEMTITGWEQPPRYNETTNNLEWAIRGESEGEPVVNYNTRLLGREGVMRVTLVVDPALLAETMPEFQSALAEYDFQDGRRYAEYKKGDRVAEYGLAALVAGGAAAVAVKSGAFKWIWKVLVVGALAMSGFVKKLFGGGRRE